mmetsp:Transcript_84423/g.223659  ORF Transcript_84423/g.223659 Transcript_84423/m.223659 type:complete len:251 (+) Transcript_84423:410-1162(+)
MDRAVRCLPVQEQLLQGQLVLLRLDTGVHHGGRDLDCDADHGDLCFGLLWGKRSWRLVASENSATHAADEDAADGQAAAGRPGAADPAEGTGASHAVGADDPHAAPHLSLRVFDPDQADDGRGHRRPEGPLRQRAQVHVYAADLRVLHGRTRLPVRSADQREALDHRPRVLPVRSCCWVGHTEHAYWCALRGRQQRGHRGEVELEETGGRGETQRRCGEDGLHGRNGDEREFHADIRLQQRRAQHRAVIW